MSYTTPTAEDEYSPFVTPSRNATAGRREPRRVESPFVEQLDAWTGEDEGPDAVGVLREGGAHPNCTKSGIGIQGTDDRRPVADTLAIPSRWICQLWIRHEANGVVTHSGATGVLVGPRHVLTVAHALLSRERDAKGQSVIKKAVNVRVSPGRDGSDRPFGAMWASIPGRLSPGWAAETMRPDQDYALLTLDARVGDKTFPRIGGAKLCYWGAASCGHRAIAKRVPPQTLAGATAFTSGYPKDRGNGESPLHGSGVLSGVHSTRRLMSYSADACQGQSGSPVWVNVGGELRLVGLLVMVTPTTTLVLRVTRELSRQLRSWLGKESGAFLGEVTLPSGGTPEAEWDTRESESEASSESSEGAWIDAPTACQCCRSSGAREQEAAIAEPAIGEWNETPAHEDTTWEGAVDEDTAPTAEWDATPTAETEPEWRVDEAGEQPAEMESPELLGPPIGAPAILHPDVEDVWTPEQQVPPTALAFLPYMSDIIAPINPGFYNAAGAYHHATPTLQTCVAGVDALPNATKMKYAVVDLSKSASPPEFAGVRFALPATIGSIGKAAVMYAAFQLRGQLGKLLTSGVHVTKAAAFAAQRAAWLATQTPPPGPPTPVSGDLGRRGSLMTFKGSLVTISPAAPLPDFAKIFDPLSATIDFHSKRTSLLESSANACDEFAMLYHDAATKQGANPWFAFLQRMKMMAGLSDNAASGVCIDQLGFAYINSVMVQSGLWDPVRGGGIWISANYAGRGWRKSPQPIGGFVQSGSAGAVAALFTLLARGMAVDSGSSGTMRDILLKSAYPGAGTRSPVKQALDSVTGRKSKVTSKLGLVDNTVNDAAIVERVEGGKSLKYVVVILGAPTDAELTAVALALDNCVRRNNGLP